MPDFIKLKGHVKVWLGNSLVCDSHNRVVKVGLDLLARLINQESGALIPSVFNLGNSAALTTQEMKNLQGTQIASCPCTLVRRNNVLSWSGSFLYDLINEKSCREIGLFNAETEPVMLARFLPVQQFTLKSGTPVKINWEIIVGE